MNFATNFGIILAMAGFIPTAEFWQGGTQMQVKGAYQYLPGGNTNPPPGPGPAPTNQLAVIAMLCTDLTCTFSGSGSSDPDGTIASYDWTFLSGQTIVGEASGVTTSFTFLATGTYTVHLLVTDDKGGTGGAQTTVTVSAPPPSTQFTLAVTAFKDRGLQKAQLDWSGTTATQFDVYRNTVKIATVSNTGRYIDNINKRGAGVYTYKVCQAGTTTCSNEAQAIFQ